MTIRHVDRTGKPWTFEIDCTPEQGQMFQRLLLSVRNIGNREELRVSYLAEWDSNTAFRNGMENAVLSALRDWAGTLHEKPTEEPRLNLNYEPDEREPYYWENF